MPNLSCIGTDSSSSSLISNTLQDIPRHIKRPYCLLTAYTWEVVQKFVQTVPARQIIKQVLYGYAGSHENGRTAHKALFAVKHAVSRL